MTKWTASLASALAAGVLGLASAAPALTVGEKAPTVELSGDKGGRVDGSSWSSSMIKDKVYFLFYVDPDEKDANEALENALAAEKFPEDKQASIAVINLDATWLPNAAISSSLESKQKKYPKVTYVKDLKKQLVSQWKLKDDAYVTVVFDKDGKVLYQKDGTLSKGDIKKMIDITWAAVKAP